MTLGFNNYQLAAGCPQKKCTKPLPYVSGQPDLTFSERFYEDKKPPAVAPAGGRRLPRLFAPSSGNKCTQGTLKCSTSVSSKCPSTTTAPTTTPRANEVEVVEAFGCFRR